MLLFEKIVKNQNNEDMLYRAFGPNENEITGTSLSAKPTEEIRFEEERLVTQLDRIEAQTAYIAMMMDGGDLSADI